MPDNLFKTAPKEVIDYFDRRPSVPTFDWRDIAAHEHALAHTVAKTAGFEILGDLRNAIRKAVVDRMPFDQFRAELEPLLKQKGWWGLKRRIDPATKQPVLAQLGSPRRLQIIHWANVHSAHAAGEWARVQQNREFLPWLTYVASVSERKRPLHMSWVGTTLPVDDPWWRTHYPPNGWNCKCSVRQIGDREAGRLHQEFGRDKAPSLDERDWLNRRTGETEKIPAGIDPGWQNNPGMLRDRTVSRQLQSALDRMEEPARREAVADLARHPLTEYVASGQASRDNHVSVAVLPKQLVDAAEAKSTVLKMSGEIGQKATRRGKSGNPHHPEATAAAYTKLQDIVDHGAILRDGDREFRFEMLDPEDGFVWRAAIRKTNDGAEWFLSTFYKLDSERARVDRLRRARKGLEIEPEILREEKR